MQSRKMDLTSFAYIPTDDITKFNNFDLLNIVAAKALLENYDELQISCLFLSVSL